jgi:hypothetical protein
MEALEKLLALPANLEGCDIQWLPITAICTGDAALPGAFRGCNDDPPSNLHHHALHPARLHDRRAASPSPSAIRDLPTCWVWSKSGWIGGVRPTNFAGVSNILLYLRAIHPDPWRARYSGALDWRSRTSPGYVNLSHLRTRSGRRGDDIHRDPICFRCGGIRDNQSKGLDPMVFSDWGRYAEECWKRVLSELGRGDSV